MKFKIVYNQISIILFYSYLSFLDKTFDAIGKNEPRVSVDQVDITFEENGISLNISYIIKNINRAGSISTSLTRAA